MRDGNSSGTHLCGRSGVSHAQCAPTPPPYAFFFFPPLLIAHWAFFVRAATCPLIDVERGKKKPTHGGNGRTAGMMRDFLWTERRSSSSQPLPSPARRFRAFAGAKKRGCGNSGGVSNELLIKDGTYVGTTQDLYHDDHDRPRLIDAWELCIKSKTVTYALLVRMQMHRL